MLWAITPKLSSSIKSNTGDKKDLVEKLYQIALTLPSSMLTMIQGLSKMDNLNQQL